MFGSLFGAFAVWKFLPIQRELSQANPLFRKAWMRYPLLIAAFGFTYHVSTMLPVKLFNKFSKNYKGIDYDNKAQDQDLVSRFRVFDRDAEAQAGNTEPSATEEEILNYLCIHSKDPLSKPELLDHMMKQAMKKTNLLEKFRVKRSGKDRNDTYWNFGKIHGLENIAYVKKEDLKDVAGNPVKLQELVHSVKPSDIPGYPSYEQFLVERQ